MDAMLLEIITPQRKAFSEKVEGIFVPTVNGIIGILPKHIPLFTSLTDGEVKILHKGKEMYMAIGGGFMEVTKTKVSILVTQAVHAQEINEAELKKAQKDARDILAQKGKTDERASALMALRRSSLELRVLSHHKKHRPMPTIS